MKTYLFISFAFIWSFIGLVPATCVAQSKSNIKKIVSFKEHTPKKHKEVVFVLTELSCQSTIGTTIKFVNQQDTSRTSVMVIAHSDKALKYGDRFSDLNVEKVYFMSIEEAANNGLFLEGPLSHF
jgi:PHP family Zn ribbon phosphoesterase